MGNRFRSPTNRQYRHADPHELGVSLDLLGQASDLRALQDLEG